MIFTIFGFITAASIGAFLRWQSVQLLVHPWGTFTVNLIGSLLIGFLAVSLARFPDPVKTILLVAFLGSLTTFSSYALEIVTFIEEGLYGKALLYFVLSNFIAILGCFIGWKVAHNLVTSG